MARLIGAPPPPPPPHLLLLLLCISCNACTLSAADDTLTSMQLLVGDATLVSANKIFELGFFSPQGSKHRYVGIWYHHSKVSIRTIVWVANRGHPITGYTGSLSVASNGTLCIMSGNMIVWSSPSLSLRNPVAQLLDNGNFVIRESNNNGDPMNYAWQSFHHYTDVVLPGMKVGWDPKSGINSHLVAWKSTSDPSPSDFKAILTRQGFPQLKVTKGSTLLWRGGPWNGLTYSGAPVMKSYDMMSFQFVTGPDEVSYMFEMRNASIISHVILNEAGSMQRVMWIEENQYWKTIWSAPTGQYCDTPSFCGPNGVCNPNNIVMCDCPRGFRPRNPVTWTLEDGSDGCVRNNSLNCRTDGFAVLRQAKLPDTSNSSVDMSLSLEQCRLKCLKNCSCTAYATANIISGVGCITWVDEDLIDTRVFSVGGQDLYIRLAAADLEQVAGQDNFSHKNRLPIVAAIFICCIVALALVAFSAVLARKMRNKSIDAVRSFSQSTRGGTASKEHDEVIELPIYDFETICSATNNFSSSNMLGQGGFGLVYKGTLIQGQEIAVKRLSRTSAGGINEFKTEVMLIAKLQHRNLVQLLGYSIAGEERILVYEYMANKSLDAFLFEKSKGFQLSWHARYNIIKEIARGLVYLHHDSRFRIIHRDLKASNILLDNDLNPKISDFGLARILGNDDAMNITRTVVGTYGYMSPEYAMNGLFSVKSDVFSFGVLVLEIISGVRNKGVYRSNPKDYLLGNAWSLWNDGASMELMDPLIGEEYSINEVMRCIKVGLLCVQEHPEDRPTMSHVVIMLVDDNMILPQPKRPGFLAERDDVGSQSSSNEQEYGSFNYMTLTAQVGR